jgi:hypothetical protein
LICKIGLQVKIFDDKSKKSSLKIQIHTGSPINADKAGVEENIREDTFLAWSILRSPKVFAIPGDENPVLIEQNLLQLPVLPARLPNPDDMRRFVVTAFAGHQWRVQR